MKILFSVIYVDANVKTSMILLVILQEGNITSTEHNQYYSHLVWPFGGFVVWSLVLIIPNKVSANLKFIHFIHKIVI